MNDSHVPHPVSSLVHHPLALHMPIDSRAADFMPEPGATDLKGYFNIL